MEKVSSVNSKISHRSLQPRLDMENVLPAQKSIKTKIQIAEIAEIAHHRQIIPKKYSCIPITL